MKRQLRCPNSEDNWKVLDGRVLVKVHDLPVATFWKLEEERAFARSVLRESPAIYVHRDGRDVMASLYYYMQSFDEDVKKQSFSEFLRSESKLDGIDTGMSRPGLLGASCAYLVTATESAFRIVRGPGKRL